ncbi:hypothetical protein G3I59_36760 [Amycolatopsis rubida]|uniref:Uncharacterized protein n=1 Tax=Amycolatopsis rubida TaxID=112413 RepID=A0ABX0C375_9PSEU|nr:MULTISPECIES: hypothetical protein [Amycolatopsis]MYW96011.1 hypothetical protein [Amycolatopsis rubida]NEC61002.1 hypothetical protein [Amycolatopsis rubida]
MGIAETLAAKTVSENILQKVFSVIVGICSTIWIGFAAGARITSPIDIAGYVGDYLGLSRAADKLTPVTSWSAEPRHLALFIGAAVIAGMLFNLSAAPTVPIQSSAAQAAWVFFLVAVQGAGFFVTLGICVSLGVIAFGFAWLQAGDSVARPLAWTALWTNLAINALGAFYPLSLLLIWFSVSYKGNIPEDSSREYTQPTGAAPSASSPLGRREY